MTSAHELSSAAQRGLRPSGCIGTAARPAITPPRPQPSNPAPREERIEIPIPAITDEATPEAVAATARDNSSYNPRRTEPDTFLLRQLLHCAHCPVKLNCYGPARNHTTTRYYLCPHRDPWRAGGAEHRCPERRVRADELDTFVFNQVRRLLTRPDLITAGQTAVTAHTPALDELLTAQLPACNADSRPRPPKEGGSLTSTKPA